MECLCDYTGLPVSAGNPVQTQTIRKLENSIIAYETNMHGVLVVGCCCLVFVLMRRSR